MTDKLSIQIPTEGHKITIAFSKMKNCLERCYTTAMLILSDVMDMPHRSNSFLSKGHKYCIVKPQVSQLFWVEIKYYKAAQSTPNLND